MKIRIIGITLILVSLMFGAIYGSKYYKDSLTAKSGSSITAEQEAKEIAAKAKEEYLKNAGADSKSDVSIQADEEASRRIRVADNDVVGKLTMDACKIESLVYENEEDDYYLRRDATGKESRHGEIYTNCYDAKVPIIYGHHMLDGTMFGNLDCAYIGANITLEDIGYLEDVVRNYIVTRVDKDVPANEVWDRLGKVDEGLVLITCSYGVEDGRLIVFASESPAE